MLILKSKNLTIQLVKKLKLAVFTWRGQTPPDVYYKGTIQSLEILRDHPTINRIIVDKKEQSIMMPDDIEASVKSTIDYLGIAQGNYRVAVVPPSDLLAKNAVDLYVDALNQALRKRFVVRRLEDSKSAFLWLIKPKYLLFATMRLAKK